MVSSEEEVEIKPADGVEWDVDMEIQLFYAMANHKPVGINKHFQMACIWEKLTNSTTKQISTHDIWQHLGSMYDLQMLDETESIPFPNEEVPFSLPDAEYGPLIKQKCKEIILADDSEETHGPSQADGRSPSPKTTPRSSSRGTVSKDSTPKATIRKDSTTTPLATKSRKESGSSHASTDTPSVKSEKEFDRRRDSRDSNASGPREAPGPGRKAPAPAAPTAPAAPATAPATAPARDKTRPRASAAAASPADEEVSARRGRRRALAATPPAVPAKRRRT